MGQVDLDHLDLTEIEDLGAGFVGLQLIGQGKVRNIYRAWRSDHQECLILEATDRISAQDIVLPDLIPGKGQALTHMSSFWLNLPGVQAICPNHFISTDPEDMPAQFQLPSFAGRVMLVRQLHPLPVECIVRGYLTGSGLASYSKDLTVCGIPLPAGLTEASELPEPIFTPTTKTEIGQHDEHIDFEQMEQILIADLRSVVGKSRAEETGKWVARQIRAFSLSLYRVGAAYALRRGIIIADTKFEFGVDESGQVYLIDEVLTPDSSRFWPAEGYQPGQAQPSLDKQPVRNWLASHYDGSEPPHLPATLIESTSARYREIDRWLTS